MTPQAMIAISATVVLLTQFIKWAGVPNRYGPVVCAILALVGEAVWAVSQPTWVSRLDAWEYFAAWAMITASAAGIFGFVRAADDSAAVTKMRGTGSGTSVVLALLLGGSLLSGCASLPVKQKATMGLQAAHLSVGAAQDTEMALYAAKAPSLTPKVHGDFGRFFEVYFHNEAKAIEALLTWRASDPVPQTIPDALRALYETLSLTTRLTDDANKSSIAGKINDGIAKVKDVLQLLGGVE